MNFLCCANLKKISMLFFLPRASQLCTRLYTVGCKPVLPPDLKAKRSVILRRCDYQILLTCFKCYQLYDHSTSSYPKSKEYKICSICASQDLTHRECISSIWKCINCKEEGNDHSTLAMSWPFRKNVSKKKRQEIMHNTNNRHLNNSHRPFNHILLIHIHMYLLIAIVLANLHQLPQSIQPQVTLPNQKFIVVATLRMVGNR